MIKVVTEEGLELRHADYDNSCPSHQTLPVRPPQSIASQCHFAVFRLVWSQVITYNHACKPFILLPGLLPTMPTVNLTAVGVGRIKPPRSGQMEYYDRRLPAFGLRVSYHGTKSWFVMTRLDGRL